MKWTQQAIRGSDAFTLIEVMLAVVISSLVLAAIAGVFYGAIRLREHASKAAEEAIPIERAINLMTHDLCSLMPTGVIAGAMSSDTTSIGMNLPVALEFYASTGVINDNVPWGDVQRIDYSLQEPTNRADAIGRDLIRSVSHNLLATAIETPDQTTLLKDVQTLQFSFYDGTNWNNSWGGATGPTGIPAAIRVSVAFATSSDDTSLAKIPIQFLVPVVTQSRTNATSETN